MTTEDEYGVYIPREILDPILDKVQWRQLTGRKYPETSWELAEAAILAGQDINDVISNGPTRNLAAIRAGLERLHIISVYNDHCAGN